MDQIKYKLPVPSDLLKLTFPSTTNASVGSLTPIPMLPPSPTENVPFVSNNPEAFIVPCLMHLL